MPGTASPGVKRLMIWPSAGQCQLTPPAAREPPLATAGAGGGTAAFGSPATGTSVLTAVAGAASTVGACTARAVAGPVAVDTWGLAGGAEADAGTLSNTGADGAAAAGVGLAFSVVATAADGLGAPPGGGDRRKCWPGQIV